MERPLIIIHGWSDNSSSFRKLALHLQTRLKRSPKMINLPDYISMDDEITFDDIVAAMAKAWHREKLPQTPYSTDIIVHSTGGLIIRDWLISNYQPDKVPVKHLVMLAPANFGSPLAHKGQSFYGRIIKGFNSPKPFQIGLKILQGLELASPYSWRLAMQDRFSSKDYYGPNKILCTVLVGNSGFSGISAAANEEGSDGIVRISTANLNCAFLDADFSNNPLEPTFTMKKSTGKIAFGIIDKENHSTIVAKDNGPKSAVTLDYVTKALQVTDNEFKPWCNFLAKAREQGVQTTSTTNSRHYQNSVFFVQDQFGNHIQDYFLEFFINQKGKQWFAEIFHRDVIKTVHSYSADKSYRSVYVDCTTLGEQLIRPWEGMNLSLTAVPEFNRHGSVGYRTFSDKDIGAIMLTKEQVNKLFKPNHTLLVRLTLRREQADHLFVIKKLV